MISLYNTLKESLLSDFDDLEASLDPIKEIKQFIKANYKTKGRLQISKRPNENGKYEVRCDSASILNKTIISLTNNLFEWDVIEENFSCFLCRSLTSLEGAPKEVGGSFNCISCSSLTSLKGAPEVVGGFSCANCSSLTSLEGAPKEVEKNFYCQECSSLTSLKGAPKEVGGNFGCWFCPKLTSLKDAPKEVGGDFDCWGCGVKFTENDVKKVCKVTEEINC